MQPPIPLGSTLRDRYTVRQVLGQGGMGRTYLAQDMERFNEACVLKEFIPANSAPEAVVKAKELFQREASTLYQIKHPQVPDFRATFEAGGRLFLVQDYVEGHSFREMLIERLKHKHTFNEAEVTSLLFQVLPILTYLHGRHIIHRDISPENLMLRTSDRLPVLIDFGVVKETATKLISHTGSQVAVVGKLGYAPPEQMQSGRAYANSDLYALAATVVVLLTGREPQDLFDDTNLTWYWQRFANTSPNLEQVLNRMLSYKPSDRYSSADEVLQALQFAQASLSEVKTAVAGSYAIGTADISQKTVYAEPNSWQNSPVKPKSQGVNIFVGIGLVLISGVASWAIASAFLNRNSGTTVSPSPSITSSPTPTQVITNINKPLEFPAGSNRATVTDKIKADQTITYRLTAKKGQIMTASLTGSGLIMTLIYEDQKPIDKRSENLDIGYWQGKLPANGAYFVIIKTATGIPESSFNLDVQIETNTPSPIATPTPTPSPIDTPKPTPTDPAVISKTVEFLPGEFSKSVEATVKPQQIIQYNVNMLEGQNLKVISDGNVMVEIVNPFGEVVWDVNNINSPKIKNTQAGTYQINVTSTTESAFRLDINAN